VGPSGTREYSSFVAVGESEVGGQCFILRRCCHWRIPLSLTAVGNVRSTKAPEKRVKGPSGGQDPLIEQKC
jgi:hypothetical protein